MRTSIHPRQWSLIIFGIIFVLYVLFQARFLILGPRITISTPRDGEVVHNPLVIVSGKAFNVSYLSLNDRQIFTDEDGQFSEKLIAAEGLSIMTLRGRDRFGRETVKSLKIILN